MTQPQESGRGVIKVKLLRAGRVIRSYKVRSETFTIGTAKGSTIRAAGDPSVKPTHATIYIDEGELTLVPEPGAEVQLNGETIDFAVPSPDDLIKIGKLTLQVELVTAMDSMPPGAVASRPPRRPSRAPNSVSPPGRAPASATALRTTAPPELPRPSGAPPAELPRQSMAPTAVSEPAPRPAAPMAKAAAPPPPGSDAGLRRLSRSSEEPGRPSAPVPSAALPRPSSAPSAGGSARITDTGAAPSPRPLEPPPALRDDITFDFDDETAIFSGATTLPREALPSSPPARRTEPPTARVSEPPTLSGLAAFPDLDPNYYFDGDDDDDCESVASFNLAEQLLSRKIDRDDGPKEPYSVAHVIRVVDDRVVDAFGVIPKRPYRTIDGELKCHIDEDSKARTSRLRLETGPSMGGEVWIGGQRRVLGATPSFKAELKDGDHALLKGAGGIYRIEVYRPPLAPKKGQLFSISYPMLTIVIALALALHGAAAYALRHINLDRIGDISKEEEEVFAEVVLETKDTPKPPDEHVVEEVAQDAKSIAERAPAVSQRTIKKRINETTRSKQQQVSSLLNVLSSGSGKAGKSNQLKDLISNIDAVKGAGGGSGFSIAGAIASLPGKGINIARSGGGGAISTLSGDEVAGKGSGLASLGTGKRKGKVRGQVTKMSSGAKIGGSLSREDVLRVINSHIHAIQACYERALMGNPSLSGRIAMDWTVATTGRVKSVRVRSSTIGNPQVASCISGVIKRWKFPQPKGGEANITFPFLFRSGS